MMHDHQKGREEARAAVYQKINGRINQKPINRPVRLPSRFAFSSTLIL